MIRSRERFVWVAALMITVIAWILSGHSKAPASEKTTQVRSNDGHDRISRSADSIGASERRSVRDEKALKKVTNQALSTPSRIERFQRVMGVLDETTAENWKTIWEEYIRQTLKEGRVHEAEWSLFMTRVGEVAGPDAMEYFSHNAQSEYTFNRREVLRGWAAMNPEDAYQWLKAQPEEGRNQEFWQSVLDGATSRDPKIALDWLKEVPAAYSESVARQTVGTQIQARGFAETIDVLEKLAGEVPEGTPPPPYLQAFYKELKTRSQRMEWLGKSYPDIDTLKPELGPLISIFEPGMAGE